MPIAIEVTRVHRAGTENRKYVVLDVENRARTERSPEDERRRKNMSNMKRRAKNHVLSSDEYKYFFTLSTTDKELQDNPKAYKATVSAFLRSQGVSASYALEMGRSGDKDGCIGLHVHGLCDKPLDLSEWESRVPCDSARLYCDVIHTSTERCQSYMHKNISRTKEYMPPRCSLFGYVKIGVEEEEKTTVFVDTDTGEILDVFETAKAKRKRLEREENERKERVKRAFLAIIESNKTKETPFASFTKRDTTTRTATRTAQGRPRTPFHRRI